MRKRFFSNSSQATQILLKQHKFFSSTTTSSQPPQPLLTVMRGFNLFSKPLLLSRRRGLTRKIAETVDFSLIWYRGTRDELFNAAALGIQGYLVKGSEANTIKAQKPSIFLGFGIAGHAMSFFIAAALGIQGYLVKGSEANTIKAQVSSIGLRLLPSRLGIA